MPEANSFAVGSGGDSTSPPVTLRIFSEDAWHSIELEVANAKVLRAMLDCHIELAINRQERQQLIEKLQNRTWLI